MEGFKSLANAAAVFSQGGQNEVMLQSEIMLLMQGQASAHSRLGSAIKAMVGGDLKTWVEEHKQAGDFLEQMNKVLAGFGPASKDIANTWGAVKTSFETTINIMQRMAFSDVYAGAIEGMKALNGFMQQHIDDVKGAVKTGWEAVKLAVDAVKIAAQGVGLVLSTTIVPQLTDAYNVSVALANAIVSIPSILAQSPGTVTALGVAAYYAVGGLTGMAVAWTGLSAAIVESMTTNPLGWAALGIGAVYLAAKPAVSLLDELIHKYTGLNLTGEAFYNSEIQRAKDAGKAYDDLKAKVMFMYKEGGIMPSAAMQKELGIVKTPDVKQPLPSADNTDPEAQARYDKQLLDSEQKLRDEITKYNIAASKIALQTNLDNLKTSLALGTITAKEELDKRYQYERAAAISNLALLNDKANQEYAKYSTIYDKSGSDDTQINAAELEYQKAYNAAKEAALKINEQSDAHTNASALLNLKASKDQLTAEIALLNAKGDTAAATREQIALNDLSRLGMTKENKEIMTQVDYLTRAKTMYDEVLASKKAIDAMNATQSAFDASQVGKNSAGGFDSLSDQIANQMAVLADAHNTKMKQLQDEYDLQQRNAAAAIGDDVKYNEAMKRAAKAQKDMSNENIEYSQKGTKTTQEGYKSALSAVSQYAGVGAQMFTQLADAQDQSSRKGFESAKALNIASAVMSTAAGIIGAFANPGGYPGLAMAALAAVTGAVQIAKIASTTFGGGSSSVSAPGSFSGGSAGTGGTVGGSIGAPISSVHDSQSQVDLQRIASSMENASLALGKVADGLTKISDAFTPGSVTTMSTGTLTAEALKSGTSTMTNLWMATGIRDSVASLWDAVKGNVVGAFEHFGESFINMTNATMNLFFGGAKSITGQGLSLGLTGGKVTAQNYVNVKTDGGWFGSDHTDSTYTNNPNMQKVVQSVIDSISQTILRGAVVTGTVANLGQANIAPANISTAGRSADDISKDLQAWLTSASNELAKTVVGLKDFAFYGENAFDALVRLSTALQSTNEGLSLIGARLVDSTLAGANAAYKLQEMMGGADAFTKSIDGYFTAIFSTQEQAAAKAAQAQQQVTVAFAEMGLSVPATKDQFKALVDSLNLSTDAGAATFAALMNVSTAFGTVQDQLAKVADTTRTFNNDLAAREMTLAGVSTDLLNLRIQQADEMKQAILDGMDTTRLATVQNEEWAAAVAKATGVVTNSITSIVDAAKAAVTNMVDAQIAIANSMKTIMTGPLAGLSPEAAYNQAQARFAALQGKTDLASMQALPQAAQDLLTASKAYNASGAAYQTDLKNVLEAMNNALGLTGDPTVDTVNKQLLVLQDIKTALTTGVLVTELGGTGPLAQLIGTWNTATAAQLQANKEQAAAQTMDKLTPAIQAVYDNQAVIMKKAQAESALTVNQSDMSKYQSLIDTTTAQIAWQKESLRQHDATYGVDNWLTDATNATIAALQSRLSGYQSAYDSASSSATMNQSLIDAANAAAANMPGLMTTMNNLADVLRSIIASYINPTGTAINTMPNLPAFALGGIAYGPSIFGEAGPEAAVPLPDGHSIPVTLSMSGYSDNRSELNEIKAELRIQSRIMVASDNRQAAASEKLDKRMAAIETKARLAA